ncbi:retrovirus-related Pol polyprotein from transposon 297 [Trichonephila clavipes]|nr:retrovirus-related Pol polyprotein from transposon 297 [Trichonephila clavipes]
MKDCRLNLDFDKKSLVIPDDQIKPLPIMEKPVKLNVTNLYGTFPLILLGVFGDCIDFVRDSKLTLDFNKKSLVIPDDQIKQLPTVEKPFEIDQSYAKLDSPEAYRFAIDYRKLNAITKYPRYPLPVIDDLITNIPHTAMMSTLDLKSGYFQLAINPKDIEKTAFITRNGTFAILRIPFGISGAAPNFQKAIDIILKLVLGRFVSCYMDDVIITSPSFNENIDNLNQIFTLLRDAGLTKIQWYKQLRIHLTFT